MDLTCKLYWGTTCLRFGADAKHEEACPGAALLLPILPLPSMSAAMLTRLSSPLSYSSDWTGFVSAAGGLLSLPPVSISLGIISAWQVWSCWYHLLSSTCCPLPLNMGTTHLPKAWTVLPLLVCCNPGSSMNMSASGAISPLWQVSQ